MDLIFWIVLFIILSSSKDIKKRLEEKVREAAREMEDDKGAASSSDTSVTDSMSDLRDEIRRRIQQKRADEAIEQNRAPQPVFEPEEEVLHTPSHTHDVPQRPHFPQGQVDPFHGNPHSQPSPEVAEMARAPIDARISGMDDMRDITQAPAMLEIPPLSSRPVAVATPKRTSLSPSLALPSVSLRKGKYGVLKRRLRSGKGLKEAFVLNEIVSRPKSTRHENQPS